MKCGDVVLVRNNTIISRLVQWFTNSDYSHCGISLDDTHIYDINYNIKSGIRHIPYTSDMCDIYRPKFDFDEDKFKEFILKNIGNRYDFIEILKIIFRINRPDEDKEYICSTLVRDALLYASGINIAEDKFVICSPADIANSKYLEKVK